MVRKRKINSKLLMAIVIGSFGILVPQLSLSMNPLKIISNAMHPAIATPTSISLEGRWQFWPDPEASTDLSPVSELPENLNQQTWKGIQVPSNWFLEGQDLSGVVWYQRHFSVTPSLKGKVFTLQFDGIDYSADVWLNGQYLGFHEGYFQPFQFQVSDQLRFDQENTLVVRVNSPLEPTGADWSLNKRLIKGIFSHHDTRPGGAWTERGQAHNTGGIWAPVRLQISDKLAVQRLKVTPHLLEDGSGLARGKLKLVDGAIPLEKVKLRLQLSPLNFSGMPQPLLEKTIDLTPGQAELEFELFHPQPRLWWTWDHGQPNLYRVTVEVLHEDQVLDRIEQDFGFRTIAFDAQEKVWILNGKRIFLRGTNYIPTQWLSEMTPQKYRRDLDMMQQANVNAVRVHAHVLAEDFYRQSDRAGLLVWQDFPLQWGYQETPEFLKQATRQAKDMIDGLYNHPSIAIWSLQNEPPWDADWMQYKYKSYDPNHNEKLTQALFKNLQGFDDTRYLHAASLTGEHPWWGWYSHTYEKYAEPTTEPIISEYGAQALPDLASLKRIFREDELWPDSEADWDKWEYHNFQRKETFEIAKVEMGNTPEEFIENTQQYQAELTQFAAESYRRQRYQPVSSIFQFMFVENWPSVNWGIVDYWRNPKPGYEALKLAYQPVLPSIEPMQQDSALGEPVEFGLWVVNDRFHRYPHAKLQLQLTQDKTILERVEWPIDVAVDSSKQFKTFRYQPQSMGDYELNVQLFDENGERLGYNIYRFSVGEPVDEAESAPNVPNTDS